jgi:chromosome segregation ATPase
MTEYADYRTLRPANAEQNLRDRRELEKRDAEWARARRQRQREEQRAQYSEIDALRAEIDALRQECDQRYDVQMAAIGRVLGEVTNDAHDAIKKMQNELFTLVERRFGELMGRLDGILPESSRGKEFRFAGERDDNSPVDLPNPLRRRMLDS